MFSQTDFVHMERALALAARGMYTTTPNPRVGCVLVKNGEVIGEGFTQPAGQDHAEIRALKDARARGHDLRGATAYVTLEPCSHFGRTPPCANALIEARVATRDRGDGRSESAVSGRGLAHAARRRHRSALRTAGQRSVRTEHRLRVAHDARPPVGAHESRGHAGWPHRACRSATASGSPAKRRAPTATPGALARARS